MSREDRTVECYLARSGSGGARLGCTLRAVQCPSRSAPGPGAQSGGDVLDPARGPERPASGSAAHRSAPHLPAGRGDVGRRRRRTSECALGTGVGAGAGAPHRRLALACFRAVRV